MPSEDAIEGGGAHLPPSSPRPSAARAGVFTGGWDVGVRFHGRVGKDLRSAGLAVPSGDAIEGGWGRKRFWESYPRLHNACEVDRTLFHEGLVRELGDLGNRGFVRRSVYAPISWPGYVCGGFALQSCNGDQG